MPVTLAVCEPWAAVWELRLEDDRWRREEWGCIELLNDGDVCSPSAGSLRVDVEEAVDATEAVCWRRRESSRVNRFTWKYLTSAMLLAQ